MSFEQILVNFNYNVPNNYSNMSCLPSYENVGLRTAINVIMRTDFGY